MGWGREGGLLFNGDRVSVWGDDEVLGMDGGGWLHNKVKVLQPLNCALKNSSDGKLDAMCI